MGHRNNYTGRDMGEINIPQRERDALKSIDAFKLRDAIKSCMDEGYSTGLAPFRLFDCGLYVHNQLGYFERALANLRAAKAPKKVADTLYEAEKTGLDLIFAVEQMQSRLKQEEVDEQLFKVDDLIMQPGRFDELLSVRVRYQWRSTADSQWNYGSIVFTHRVVSRPDYSTPLPKRKPSAAKQEQDRQDRLRDTWNHLMSQSLHSVKDFLKDGGDGSLIPETFQVNTDDYSGHLNNHSAKFWQHQP